MLFRFQKSGEAKTPQKILELFLIAQQEMRLYMKNFEPLKVGYEGIAYTHTAH